MNTTSLTPRTDAEDLYGDGVPAYFARELEREIGALKDRIEFLEKENERLEDSLSDWQYRDYTD
jgi:cell division protein FtsB